MPASHSAACCLLTFSALACAVSALAAEVVPEVRAVNLTPEDTCPAALFGASLPKGKDAIRTQLVQLSPWAQACDMRADFHAYRGALLLSAGWPQDAAISLEKALLLNPELPGAQLDFAQALAQQGQGTPARELVRQVAERSDIQPDLKHWLQDGLVQGASLQTLAATANAIPDRGWNWSSLMQSSMGHESNLASATHTTSLTLYLASGPVEVPLADSERPKAGAAVKMLVATQGLRKLGDGELRLNLALQGRRAEGATLANNQLAEGFAAYAHPLGPGVLQGAWGAHSFSQPGVYSYKDQVFSLKYEPSWRFGDCKSSIAHSLTAQRYLSAPSLDGTYQQLRLEAGCGPAEKTGIDASTETIWGLTTGRDTPSNTNRPGGNKHRVEAYARHERNMVLPLSNRQGRLTAWYRYSVSQDERVFSGLLGIDPTRTHRQDGGLGYWLPIRQAWSAGVDVESTSQKSTNTLLNIKNLTTYVGLRWALN